MKDKLYKKEKMNGFIIIHILKDHYFKNIILITINIIIIISFSTSKYEIISSNYNYIFTFWEPHDSLPGYLTLCIKTWKKYLANNYKIIILDYSNIRHYLGYKIVKQILCLDMTLPIQSDAIRVAILQKYGGIWMDADILIVNSKFITMLNGSDLVMFGTSKNQTQHIGFIYASNKSTILKAWLDRIINNVRIYKYKLVLNYLFPIKYFKKSFEELNEWSYLGNGIIDSLVNNASEKDFKRIEKEDAYSLPEQQLLNKDSIISYINFYFTNNYSLEFLDKCKGVILLHNSWTPKKYKDMSAKEFLKQDILLARLFFRLLNENN